MNIGLEKDEGIKKSGMGFGGEDFAQNLNTMFHCERKT